MTRGRSTWRGRFMLAAGTLGALLIAGELALRLLMPQLLLWDTSVVWEPADGLRWRRHANLDVHVNTGERDARILSDAARHRVGPVPAAPAGIRILAVGDSMVEALQVNYEQTMTALLERSLSARLGRDVSVVNAGVGGYDPNQYRMVAQSELRQSKYDLILVFVYAENDFIRRRVDSYPADTSLVRPALRPLSDSPAQTLRVLNIRGRAWLASSSHLFVFVENGLSYLPVLWQTLPPGMFHLFSAALRSNRDVPEWGVTGDILNEIGAAADEAHVPIVFVLLPSTAYVDPAWRATVERSLRVDPATVDLDQPATRLGEELRKRGRELQDATPALRDAYAAGERQLYGRVDRHFSPEGHQVMAKFLEPIVRDRLLAAGASR